MSDKEIQNKLNSHVQLVREKFPNYTFYFCALYGSQNYGLDTEDSDVDTKIAVIPSGKDIILGYEKLSTTLRLEDGSVCEVKDIREMANQFYKGNINFTEMLYTPYYIQNENIPQPYSFDVLKLYRDMIANRDPLNLMKMVAAMARTKYLTLTKVNNNNKEAIEKYGYDSKSLVTLLRLETFMYNYLFDYPENYSLCLVPGNNEDLRRLKINPVSFEVADGLAKNGIEAVDGMLNMAKDTYSTEEWQDKITNNSKKVNNLLEDFTCGLIYDTIFLN